MSSRTTDNVTELYNEDIPEKTGIIYTNRETISYTGYVMLNDYIFSTNYSLTCHHVKEAFKVTKFLGQDPPSERASNVIKKDPNGGNEKVAEYEIE